MPVTLPASYTNAAARPADHTQTQIDLFNVVQQLNGVGGTGIGYVTGQGVGASVIQATNRTTGLTINALTGQIIGQGTSLAASTAASFTVTNSFVGVNDTICLSIQSGLATGATIFSVSAVANGSFNITAINTTIATADTTAPTINFTVIKGSAN